MEPFHPLLIPPILTIIDDFNPIYKIRGIRLLKHAVIDNHPVNLANTGLGMVFFNVS